MVVGQRYSDTYQFFTAPRALSEEARARVAGVIDLGPQGPQVFYINPGMMPLLTSILKFLPRPLVIPDYVMKSLIPQAQQLGLSIQDIELGHDAAVYLKPLIQPLIEKGDYQALSQFLSSTGASVNGIEFFDSCERIRIRIYGSGLVIIEGEAAVVQQRITQLLERLLKLILATLVLR